MQLRRKEPRRSVEVEVIHLEKRAKRAFPPTWRLECGKRVWKGQNNPPLASAAFEACGCRCLVFLVLAPACAAVRFGLLLSTLSTQGRGSLTYSKQL